VIRAAQLGLAVAAVGVLAVVTAGPAAAHADLEQASPGPGAVLEAPPSEVVLVFGGPVQPAVDALVVSGADGSVVDHDEPVVDPPNVMSVALRTTLVPGTYTVAYRVVSDDSHVVEGSHQFTVTAAATTVPVATGPTAAPLPVTTEPTATLAAAAPTPAPKRDDSNSFGVLLIIVAAVIGVAGGVTAWLVNRRTRD
jgi:copper resistance protein C